MNSNFLSAAFTKKHFKSLPNGMRVFLAEYPWSGYYLIPNSSVESRLIKITLWTNVFLLVSAFAIFGGLVFLRDSVKYTSSLFWLVFIPLAGVTRWILYSNELQSLQKVDLISEISAAYRKLSEDLRIYSKDSLPNYEIGALLEIPDSEDKIVMLRYNEAFSNIIRCSLNGSIIWQAELPTTSNDVYTNVEWTDGELHAFSRSCMSVLLDKNTGKIVSDK